MADEDLENKEDSNEEDSAELVETEDELDEIEVWRMKI
jgi:hypothetical protein